MDDVLPAPQRRPSNRPPGIEVIASPVDGRALGEVARLGRDAILDRVARAREAQREWAARPLPERCAEVIRFRDALVDHAEEIVDLLAWQLGKPRVEGLTHELMTAVDMAGYFAKRAPAWLAPQEMPSRIPGARHGYLHYAPRGVVAVFAPFNYPFLVAVGEAVMALIAGNAAIVKPSPRAPLPALLAKRIYEEAGLPHGLFEVIPGDDAAGLTLVEARPDMVLYSGSDNGGRRIAVACAEQAIPCIIEATGKAWLVVCADADIERAARAIVFGAFTNAGQTSVGVQRVLAVREVHDALCARVTDLAASVRVGAPSSNDVDMGPMITPGDVDVIDGIVQEDILRGARVGTGAGRLPELGPAYYRPTVLLECTEEMSVMREGLVGPVVGIARVEDERRALEWIERNPHGVAAYVFTKDRERGRRLGEQIRAGSVLVNDVLAMYGTLEAPYGGFKRSGHGTVHGADGLRALCEVRHLGYDRLAVSRETTWFPYGDLGYRAALKGVRLLFRSGSAVKKVLDLF